MSQPRDLVEEILAAVRENADDIRRSDYGQIVIPWAKGRVAIPSVTTSRVPSWQQQPGNTRRD